MGHRGPRGLLAGAPPRSAGAARLARIRQAAVNPRDKFELVFKNLLETLFVERMDQNEEILLRFMNGPAF